MPQKIKTISSPPEFNSCKADALETQPIEILTRSLKTNSAVVPFWNDWSLAPLAWRAKR